MSTVWKPKDRTPDDIKARQEEKEDFVGSTESTPQEMPVDIFTLLPKRTQKAWPNFTYVPPPPIIDMRNWRFETYGFVDPGQPHLRAVSATPDHLDSGGSHLHRLRHLPRPQL
jgi:hypothetical protein